MMRTIFGEKYKRATVLVQSFRMIPSKMSALHEIVWVTVYWLGDFNVCLTKLETSRSALLCSDLSRLVLLGVMKDNLVMYVGVCIQVRELS